MNTKRMLITQIILLALGFGAVARPALAVTDISFCDEITQPGSYRLTQDLKSSSATHCLLIDASNVTIDLQGHTISGNGSKNSAGIKGSNADLLNVEIRNGTVEYFALAIRLSGVRGARIEHMRVVNNQDSAIIVGPGSVVSFSTVLNNGFGIYMAGGGSVVMDNVVSENGSTGIFSDDPNNVVKNNLVTHNVTAGIDVACPSQVVGNTVLSNPKGKPNEPQNIILEGVTVSCLARDNLAAFKK